MLEFTDVFGNYHNKVEKAIKILKTFERSEGYHLAFSGGKDSVVIKALADMAAVKYEAIYNVTSVDPPELVLFIKREYKDVMFRIPKDKNGKPITMWSLLREHSLPPTRLMRYCCLNLKENQDSGGKLVITGVRWAESPRRKESHGIVTVAKLGKKQKKNLPIEIRITKQGGAAIMQLDNIDGRKIVDTCFRTNRTMINPIVDWEDSDVWEFIHKYNVPYCELYDQGYTRLGCIGCPMDVHAEQKLDKYPKFKALYDKAFTKMFEKFKERYRNFKNKDDIWDFFLHKSSNKYCEEESLQSSLEENDERS